MEVIQDDCFKKKYAALDAEAVILVECSKIGQSTANSSPVSLRFFLKKIGDWMTV